jgi:hypothetical protein
MTDSPLITAALLGTARSPVLPAAPDPSLAEVWQAIRIDNPATALLQALALTRAFHRAGASSHPASDPTSSPCPPESRPTLPTANIDSARRLLAGEFSELLPEWLHHATASGSILPARVLPDFLKAATGNPTLRTAMPGLVGERGLWIARRHPEFSWLLESATSVAESAWDEGTPAERLAWLRQTRASDPMRAAAAITSHWPHEDPAMRESIVRLATRQPHSGDEPWLETLALKDRRQDIRDHAVSALMELPESAFRQRALDRARCFITIRTHPHERSIHIDPPSAFDPTWSADAIKQKPPQGTGEKAWWLRQIIATIPIDDWPILLDRPEAELFATPCDNDWLEALLLGWLDAAQRWPDRALLTHFIPFITRLDPRPAAIPPRETLLAGLFECLPVPARFALFDEISDDLPAPAMLDLLIRCGAYPPGETGHSALAVIDAALPVLFRSLTRPQARALAACIPPSGIQSRLEAIAKLESLSTATEEFANTLEFRRSMISHLVSP